MSIKSFKGLAIEGGGVAGLAFIGNYRRYINAVGYCGLTHFAGTSAGSILAGLLAVRASDDQINTIMKSMDFNKLKDNSWFPVDVFNLFRKFGWYNGEYLLNWYRDIMKSITGVADITLLDLWNRYGTVLIITKTDVMKPFSRLVVMDYQSHPTTTVAMAVRQSCSIPEVFKAVPGVGAEANHWFVDGGVMLNYPIRLLYKYLNPDQCFGFYLTSTEDAAGNDDTSECTPVTSQLEFIESIAETWRSLAMKQHINSDDWKRTCKTEINISATKFNLSNVEKDDLIRRGEVGMENFIEKMNNPDT